MPRGGLEPPSLAALVPETSVSANSTIWAITYDVCTVLCLRFALHILQIVTFFPSISCSYKTFTLCRLQTGHSPRPCAASSLIPFPLCALDISIFLIELLLLQVFSFSDLLFYRNFHRYQVYNQPVQESLSPLHPRHAAQV